MKIYPGRLWTHLFLCVFRFQKGTRYRCLFGISTSNQMREPLIRLSLGPSPQSAWDSSAASAMAKKVWNEQSTGSRLVSGFLTALPITLIPGRVGLGFFSPMIHYDFEIV